jgi:hypothetical protein
LGLYKICISRVYLSWAGFELTTLVVTLRHRLCGEILFLSCSSVHHTVCQRNSSETVALTSCFRSIFGEIFKFKGAQLPQNLGDQNFLVICTTTYGVLTTYQVSWNYNESCLNQILCKLNIKNRPKEGNYVSPHFCGETYCFCPVRLSVTVCQRNSSATTEQNFMNKSGGRHNFPLWDDF